MMTREPDAGSLFEPDDIERPERPERASPVCLIGQGLHPMDELPTPRRLAVLARVKVLP